jgi:hypothetical protein
MLRRFEQRRAQRQRISGDARPAATVLRDGTFFVEADPSNMTSYRRLDLAGQSLVFEPRGDSKFAARRTALQYVEPAGEPFVFAESTEWYRKYDLKSFAMPLFGKSVSSIYVTAYNGIHLSAPAAENDSTQIDALEAAVHRDAVLSPLLLTKAKPKNLVHPDLYIDETADAVVLTWRSSKGKYFGYDVQAMLRRDGSVVYSYKTLRELEWGTPILTPGFSTLTPSERLLAANDDQTADVPVGANSLGAMADIARVEVHRLGDSELLMFRFRLAKAIDPAAIVENQPLRYWVLAGNETVQINVERGGATNVYAPGRSRFERNGQAARYRGDVVELFATQDSLGLAPGDVNIRAYAMIGSNSVADAATVTVDFGTPALKIATDLSATEGAELSLPIAEPFVLGGLDVTAVWDALKAQYNLSDSDIDGLAIYQAFYTDILFYAGAYSTVGNPQADGIGNRGGFGSGFPKKPALLHMNHFTYGYNSAEKSTSQVVLHEFGHRWLYHAAVRFNGITSRVLNPASAHPAQFVHMPSAFKIYEDLESSTMGGAFFAQQGDGTWIARARNAGYTWHELYLMGLASVEEVEPWFYLDKTEPRLGNEYWPIDKQVVSGTRIAVTVENLTGGSGPRRPTAAQSQRGFRVPFVLVTYPGQTATPQQLERMKAIRELFEKNFATATGGRGTATTKWPLGRRRAS